LKKKNIDSNQEITPSFSENILIEDNHINQNTDRPQMSFYIYNIFNYLKVLHKFNQLDFETNTAKNKIILNTILIVPIVVIIFSIILVNRVSTSCQLDEQKALGVFCLADTNNNNISRGDRTFFPNINNIPRDKGIQAFKNGNYQEAAELFQQAVKANRYDPEVLIYYNNALARQQGSPFTFAAVVPVTNKQNSAQEILRGVAQAQDEFNKNKGLNGRLLEIVIANDSSKPDQAIQVAQELAKDSLVLGVIGHNSDEATQAALPEYEKAKLAVISPTSTSIFLKNPVFFRTVYSDETAGQKLAEYTYRQLQLKKAVIFANPNSQYSNSIREKFTNHFEKLGGTVVREPLIDLTAATFDAEKEVAKSVYSKDSQAEAAMLFPDANHTEIALKIAQKITRRNEKLKNDSQNPPRQQLKMLEVHTLYNNETLKKGGQDVEGLIIAIPWFRGTSQAQVFAKKSQQLWGEDISWRTATSFDATQALIKTLSNNPSRSSVLEGLQNVNLKSNETSGYPLLFTQERERQGQSILVQIRNGKFVKID
jgi:branched-chain amino acid transport system substrate-binding protein